MRAGGRLTRTSTTRIARIFIAGDPAVARQACREFTLREGLCVTVAPTTFVYTGGAEDGVEVGLINYPRFPCKTPELRDVATRLGEHLMEALHQMSFTVVDRFQTNMFSRRPEDLDGSDAEADAVD